MTNRLLKAFWVVSGTLLAMRLLFIATTMVMEDEAYYLMYARHLDWGYIDHGPIVAFLIYVTTRVFGETGFGIRIGAVAMISILNWVLYRFGSTHFSKTTGAALGLLITANFLTHMNGVIMTPDAPLVFFTVLMIVFYYRAFFEDGKYFFPAGILLGLAALSKISAIFPAIGIFLFPFVSRSHRRSLRDYRFYASFIVAVAVLSPFIVWNLQNDLAFVRYQGAHVAQGGGVGAFLELWGGLALLGGPIFFYYGVIRPFEVVGRSREGWQTFFGLVTIVPLVYFVGQSLFSMLELNWLAPALCGGMFYAGIRMTKAGRTRALGIHVAYSFVLVAAITIHTWFAFLPMGRKDATNRYYDYECFTDDLGALLDANPALERVRVVSNNFQIPSMVNLYQRPQLEAICLSIGYHPTLWDFHYPDERIVGDDFVVVVGGETFPHAYRPHFAAWSRLGTVYSQRDGRRIDTYSVWLARDYRGRAVDTTH